MNDDYFLHSDQVARVNTDGKPGKHPPHGDDYFRHDCEVVRVNKDGNDPSHGNDDYFRRDDQVARVNGGDESDGDASDKTIRDAIRENALGPKKVTGDAGSVEQHPLKDQIEAEKFLASKEATRRPGLGIRLTKIVPDGTV
jgi:hypothetical protein